MNRALFSTLITALILSLPVSGKDETIQTLAYQDYRCTIEKPAGYALEERSIAVGKMFAFSDPKRDKLNFTALSVFIVPVGKESNSGVSELMDGILAPYRERLATHEETPIATSTINGKVFQSKKFSGTFKQGTATRGFIYAAKVSGEYVVMLGEANGASGPAELDKLMKSVDSFH